MVATATEIMQGWGSVLSTLFSAFATLITLLLYRHEVRSHRLERRDAEAAQARMIVLQVESELVEQGQMTVLKGSCVNFSSMPITDVCLTALRTGEALSTTQPRRRAMIGPSEHWHEIWNVGDVAWRPTETLLELVNAQLRLEFVDAAGRRWLRVGNDHPQRIFS